MNGDLDFVACDVKATAAKETNDYDDLFDDDDDRMMDEGMSDSRSPVKKALVEDDDDDDLMPATGRARNRASFLDDDNSQGMMCSMSSLQIE